MGSNEGCHIRALALKGVDPASLRVYEAWSRTLHLQRQLAIRATPEPGIHPGQARCLWAISDNDGITQRDLAEMLHLSRPTVTALLQKLEKAGAVQREADAEDQRLTRIRLTCTGRTLATKMREFNRA